MIRVRSACGLLAGCLTLAARGLPPAPAVVEGRIALPAHRVAPVVNQRYQIVSRAGILAVSPPLAVVYYLPSEPRAGAGTGAAPAAAPATAQMAQRGLAFEPTILPIEVGTRVYFPNFDSTYHNVFSYSPVKRFDLGRYRSDERPIPSIVFDRPGLVTLHCDIHEHMRAIILVLDTPHFVVTDPDGRYRLAGLPAGPGTLKVWIDSRTTRERPIELAAGSSLSADFP